jgi:hypothetical protein
MFITILIVAYCLINSQETPTINSLQIRQPVEIDCNIDKQWESAQPVDLVYNDGPYCGKIPAWNTQVRSLWNNKNLYLLFICKTKNPKPMFHLRDCDLWSYPEKMDIAEILIDPKGTGKDYYEINVNSGGGTLDSEVTFKNGKRNWDRSWPKKPFKISTKLIKSENGYDGWICEAAIPWKNLSRKPKPNMVIDANLHRADNDLPSPYLSLSPTKIPSFHVPNRFGKLTLLPSN